MPVALLEAAASGLPGGRDGRGRRARGGARRRTGFVVPPGDAEALAAAMSRVMALPESERAGLGRWRRANMSSPDFDLPRSSAQWEELYRELLDAMDVTNRFVLDFAGTVRAPGRAPDPRFRLRRRASWCARAAPPASTCSGRTSSTAAPHAPMPSAAGCSEP